MQQANTGSIKKAISVRIALSVIGFYQRWISAAFTPRCRFEPTCSSYAVEALQRFGLVAGIWLTLKRLARCHPWSEPGYDPCPQSPCDGNHRSGRQQVNTEETV